MRLMYIEWNSYGNKYVKEAFIECGHTLICYPFLRTDDYEMNEKISKSLIEAMITNSVDFCFSLNYFPIVAMVCKALNIKYLSWTYDSPYVYLYSDSIFFETNYAFIFDRAECNNLKKLGVNSAYYLPMAVPEKKYTAIVQSQSGDSNYDSNITMVGSMYSEDKHRLFNKLFNMSNYCKGYIDALIEAQKFLYGTDIVESALTPAIIDEMRKLAPMRFPENELQTPQWLYDKYFIQREVTRRERFEVLNALSNHHSVTLYTHDASPFLSNVTNLGPLDYYKDMPLTMNRSKINLNVTLRSILSGMPLRAMDILGCCGFLLTNFQADFLDYFEPNTDYVYFEDINDLLSKVDYYLSHDEERIEIAHNGFGKAMKHHTYNHRISEMINVAFGGLHEIR